MNLIRFANRVIGRAIHFLSAKVYFGRHMGRVPGHSVVLFPVQGNLFCCGLAGIVSFKKRGPPPKKADTALLEGLIEKIAGGGYTPCIENRIPIESDFLGGDTTIDTLLDAAESLKTVEVFYQIYTNKKLQDDIGLYSDRLDGIIDTESKLLAGDMGLLESDVVQTMARRIEKLKDASWCLKAEILNNIKKTTDLQSASLKQPTLTTVSIFKNINAVLNSIDRLEVRGRDSAGISLMFGLDRAEFKKFESALSQSSDENLFNTYKARMENEVLLNQGIRIHETTQKDGRSLVIITIVYKFASEVGSLGDNIHYLRNQIKDDKVLQILTTFPFQHDSVSAHTRWASVGGITESNCHPIDNETLGNSHQRCGIIHVCLNGDIDNYLQLRERYEKSGQAIHQDITTDTKIIPLLIEDYIQQGNDVKEAFRKAVGLFEGSHAITMHTDLAPGKLFLAQKGSGQSIFVGLAGDFYLSTSEVYGFVEETSYYCKMDGEKVVDGQNGKTQGQIFILDQHSGGGLDGIQAFYYDGTLINLTQDDIKRTHITSRDIDLQGFPHYYFKEISESPTSVEKTLQNRWKIKGDTEKQYAVTLDEKTVPKSIKTALSKNRIRRIFFVGQGTAGVAAQVCADILNYYLNNPLLHINALKSSELSGFKINDLDDGKTFKDSLVIAISQSGTTTDTNRTMDMVRERGAYTLAIVNRRDSDITFKVDGVMYTSSGRDIEMSVASTKAFYSQIVAGALLSLYIAVLKGSRNEAFVTDEIKQLLELPDKMRTVLSNKAIIQASANRLATAKNYWAVVGSGPNKASADEIRIKLSELCYKTISTDYVEDKKHIDLSSEPLIIVCAAGTRPNVIGDIIKDTAIFQAHKAALIIITDAGETRFDPYATDIFHVPPVSEHLSPILNTLTGHIWGYYAALAINQGSAFLYRFREQLQQLIKEKSEKGLDVYEVILDNTFRETIAEFYYAFKRQKAQNRLPAIMGLEAASDLTLLLKYLSGKLPVSDFELDFGKNGTALNMLNTLFERIGESINCLSRPVDAIKHQAKTVTVGTSRIREKVEGLLFEIFKSHQFGISHLTTSNVIVLKNLQGVVETVNGSILYKIDGLNFLGEPSEETTIEVIKKTGILVSIPSRVETDTSLKGTKRIIIRQGNVYIGKGRKDNRSILVIPMISTDSARPNLIEYLLLLNISFKANVLIETKIKALGGKYEHIKNIVQENSMVWEDTHLDLVEIEELFGKSAEKVGEFIISRIGGNPA